MVKYEIENNWPEMDPESFKNNQTTNLNESSEELNLIKEIIQYEF